jgi:RNA polymerase sigma-70 factor (ECF subfamily)
MNETSLRPTREQFDALVGPHLSCMLREARRVLGTDDLAWDAVQETLLRFWRNGRIPDQPRSALLRVVRPASLQILRSRRRRHRHEDRAAAGRAEEPPPPDCEDPVCAHERHEFRARLDAAIASLPAACRSAVRLRVTDELDYEQIAARLGVPVGTVRSRLARARELLREALVGDGPGVFPCSTEPIHGERHPGNQREPTAPIQDPIGCRPCPR